MAARTSEKERRREAVERDGRPGTASGVRSGGGTGPTRAERQNPAPTAGLGTQNESTNWFVPAKSGLAKAFQALLAAEPRAGMTSIKNLG